jgi:hypothetical protein
MLLVNLLELGVLSLLSRGAKQVVAGVHGQPSSPRAGGAPGTQRTTAAVAGEVDASAGGDASGVPGGAGGCAGVEVDVEIVGGESVGHDFRDREGFDKCPMAAVDQSFSCLGGAVSGISHDIDRGVFLGQQLADELTIAGAGRQPWSADRR